MSIIKNNKLIAQFMGGLTSENSRVVTGCQDIWIPIHGGICRWSTIDSGQGKILKYHKSWDWLMPVIDKITSMNEYLEFKDYNCSMFDDGGIFINTRFIENTWQDVVEFIKWLNNK